VKHGHAGGKLYEEQRRIDCEREDQPAEQADPEHATNPTDKPVTLNPGGRAILEL
jgi:hypothetical protein